MKNYDTTKGFSSLSTVTDALKSAYASYTDAASAQLEAMRKLGALIFRLENVADLAKLGDAFQNTDGVTLTGKKLTDAFASFYADAIAIPDTSFISDARARGLAMSVWADDEANMSRELFKKLAPVFRNSKLSHDERAKLASKVMVKAQKLANKSNGGIIIGKNIADARNASKRGTRGAATTPADALVEAASALVVALGDVRAEALNTLSDNEREALTEAHEAFGRMLTNAATLAATDAAEADANAEAIATA